MSGASGIDPVCNTWALNKAVVVCNTWALNNCCLVVVCNTWALYMLAACNKQESYNHRLCKVCNIEELYREEELSRLVSCSLKLCLMYQECNNRESYKKEECNNREWCSLIPQVVCNNLALHTLVLGIHRLA